MSDSNFALQAISPIDGRYAAKVAELAPVFSEAGLIRARLQIEVDYLIALSEALPDDKLPAIEPDVAGSLLALYREFTPKLAERVKAIEATTNHDVKAIEYLLREETSKLGRSDLHPWIHFGLTSEDINNLAYAIMIREGLDRMEASMVGVLQRIEALVEAHASTVMLARTHGQSASPTTFGKEMAVFLNRLAYAFEPIETHVPSGKLAGATGNYSAHVVAFPDLDWPQFAEDLIGQWELNFNPLTTQIETHDALAELLHAMVRFNTVLIDFNQDIWRYISDGWIGQKTVEGEVGSSTMPHKVNPIDFENSEGNLQLANAGLGFLAEKLLVSRLQRDLTDSTTMRNVGMYLAYSLLAYKSLINGLDKIEPRVEVMRQVVSDHPEVLAEPIQTLLRREGFADAYEQLKALTRGKPITLEGIAGFVEELEVDQDTKSLLRALTPEEYVGLAVELAEMVKQA